MNDRDKMNEKPNNEKQKAEDKLRDTELL